MPKSKKYRCEVWLESGGGKPSWYPSKPLSEADARSKQNEYRALGYDTQLKPVRRVTRAAARPKREQLSLPVQLEPANAERPTGERTRDDEPSSRTGKTCVVCNRGSGAPFTLPSGRETSLCKRCSENDFRVKEAEKRA